MKNIKAFFVALLMFMVSAVMLHFIVIGNLPDCNDQSCTWISGGKFACNDELRKLVADPDSIPVFGSSELKHGQKTDFHANSVFSSSEFQPVFIGQAGYQSITHAITLGSIADSMENTGENKKAVLIVSPQWFKNSGVKSAAFLQAFSEDNYYKFMKNDSISSDVKQYVAGRAKELSNECPSIQDKIVNINNTKGKLQNLIVREKVNTRLYLEAKLAGIPFTHENIPIPETLDEEYWSKLYSEAEENGRSKYDNPYNMYDSAYKKNYKNILESGNYTKPPYSADSVEFGDLECFMKICQEENIELMVVMLPFNGAYYDAVDYTKEDRKEIYDKIKSLADTYEVRLADMSDKEYDKYIFEDNSHPALKGLVYINEKIYDFYCQN